MISKEEFAKTINDLKKTTEFIEKLNADLPELCFTHEKVIISLLEKIFKDEVTISWWIDELDYGKKYKDGCLKDMNGNIIDVSTAEKLYDFLIKNLQELEED